MSRSSSGRARTTQMEAGHPFPQSETTQLSRPPQRALYSSHLHSRGRKELFTKFPGGPKLLPPRELRLDFAPDILSTVRSPTPGLRDVAPWAGRAVAEVRLGHPPPACLALFFREQSKISEPTLQRGGKTGGNTSL